MATVNGEFGEREFGFDSDKGGTLFVLTTVVIFVGAVISLSYAPNVGSLLGLFKRG